MALANQQALDRIKGLLSALGRIEAIPRAEPADDDEHVIAPDSGHGDPFGPQSRLNDPDRWLPIAHGTTASDNKKKVR